MGTRQGPPPPATARLSPRPAANAAAFLRSLVFAAAMFAVAALAGVLLSGAAPANRAELPEPAAGAVREAPLDRAIGSDHRSGTALAADTATFGRSMVVSGAAALIVSVIGLFIVGWRRRLW